MLSTKKKTRLFIVIGIVAILLTAAVMIYCFVGRSDNGGELSEYASAGLSEIVSDTKIPDKEYGNLDLSGAVLNIPQADKFYKLYTSDEDHFSAEECSSNCYELFNTVFDYVIKENSDITFSDMYGEPLPDGEASQSKSSVTGEFSEAEINYFADDGTVYSCRFGKEGYFMIYDSQLIQISAVSAGGSGTVEEVFHLDRGEKAPDTKYLVGGEEYSPAQALEFAQGVLSDRINKFLPSDKFSPAELIVIKDPASQNYIYKLQFEYVYDGAPYFHLSVPRSIEDDVGIQYGMIYMTISAPDRVGEIYNMNYFAKLNNGGEYKDKYIPLSAAADLVNDYFAPLFKQTISEITIKYVLSKSADGEKTYMRPCWCFIIDINDPLSYDYCFRANAIILDIQTGEIMSCVDDGRSK